MAGSNVARTAAMLGIDAAIVGAGALAAGCSSSSKEAPSTTSTSQTPPSPTEKGVIIMPPKAFSPNLNAADGMLALESQGDIVQLNNCGGCAADRPLSSCRITGVDGLRGDHPPANTTVYLTLSCPNSNN